MDIEHLFHYVCLALAVLIVVLVYLMTNYKVDKDYDIDATTVVIGILMCAIAAVLAVCYLHGRGWVWWM